MKWVGGDWIEYGKTWKEFRDENLVKAGVQIAFEKHSFLELIGDINENGGSCDCCSSEKETVISKYRVLLEPE